MIDITEKKRAMREALTQLEEFFGEEIPAISRMKDLTLFGDFSDLPDEIEDNSTGQVLLKYIENKIETHQWMVQFALKLKILFMDYYEKFKAGTIPKADLDKEFEKKMEKFLSESIPESNDK